MSVLTQNDIHLLARRAGYNTALRHFKITQELAENIEDGYNLADVIWHAIKSERLGECQILPILRLLLVEKYGYQYRSENLVKPVKRLDKLKDAVSEWTNIQIVLTFVDAENSVQVLNPETPDTWEGLLPLTSDTHLVCYVGALNEVKKDVLQKATTDVFKLIYGSKVSRNIVYKTSGSQKKFLDSEPRSMPIPIPIEHDPQVAATPSLDISSQSSKKMTAKLAVNVTNELFHNGNVEAWKRIFESYKNKYPHLDVLVWYDGERINDINSLFKWGKVKHGTPIMFSVAGEGPSELAKLKKYLYEGASSRFEAFLQGSPGVVLKLF